MNFAHLSAPDFYYNPGDLPLYWGIQPAEMSEQRRPDILRRFKRAMLILHPDKHAGASDDVKEAFGELCAMFVDAKERAL
eukprot:1752168-Lingulodinium_polyedra.AAC.1